MNWTVPGRTAAMLCILLISIGLPTARGLTSAVGAVAPLTIIGVAGDNSSVKIDYYPVPGAQDYRVYDVSDPTTVKYAGLTHLDAGIPKHFVLQPDGVTPVFPYTSTGNIYGSGPQTLDVPATELQWNKLDDGLAHTLVVQAVDQLGPAPPNNLADYFNNPRFPPAMMLGSNDGMTPDGDDSINGQGPYTDTPHVIAQSTPFVVQANKSLQALPSMPGALQVFYDTFDSGEAASLQSTGPVDPVGGVMTFTLGAGTPKSWSIIYQGADTDHSMPMVQDGHYMDTLFDGTTPSARPTWCLQSNACLHANYTSMSLTPQTTADLSHGKLLHMTMEVDSHMADSSRWLSFELAPATDPITNYHEDDAFTGGNSRSANTLPVNQTDRALWLQLLPNTCDAMLFDGPMPGSTQPIANQFITTGGPLPGTPGPCYRTIHWGDMGTALDNRDRWDVFLTTSHVALFEDGQLVTQADIPNGGLGFDQAKVYFTHYLYATSPSFEPATLLSTAPWEVDWLNNFPHSDERHWDNIGFEVLPSSVVPGSDFSSLSRVIQLPAVVPLTAPAISALSPTTGYTTGGTVVTITGTNFTGASSVRFGSVGAAGFTVNSPTQISAIAPAANPGTVDVSVTTPQGSSQTSLADRFTYGVPPPTVQSLSPTSGTTSGGTSVTIAGTNFTGATAVQFGSLPAASFTVNSPTLITALTPPAPSGGVDVTVTTAGGRSATSYHDRYTFQAQTPSISSVSPSSGPASGGTVVTISGSNLYAARSVFFGGVPSPSFVVDSPAQIRATAPSHMANSVDIKVVTSGGQTPVTPSDQFTFTP